MGAAMFRGCRKYAVLASKGFSQNLAYSASHLINTVASAIFGLIYINIWRAVTPPQGFADYTPLTIAHYIAFNQVTLWLTQFGMRVNTRIAESVRSGSIAQELARPVGYFEYRVVSELGSQWYSFLFRGVPVGFMLAFIGFYIPQRAETWLWTLVSLVFAGYIGVVMGYITGVTAFWTTEIRTAWWVLSNLSLGLGGASMPLEVLPSTLGNLSRALPFACLSFYPARIYLELSGPHLIWYSVFWSLAVTFAALVLTTMARRRLEVQGG
jgi:ABC-2 type transport system permease protein